MTTKRMDELTASLYEAIGQALDRKIVKKVLNDCNGNPDKALDELFTRVALQKPKVAEHPIAQLREVYPNLSVDEVQNVLEECQYDVELAEIILESASPSSTVVGSSKTYAQIVSTGAQLPAKAEPKISVPKLVDSTVDREQLIDSRVVDYHRRQVGHYRNELNECSDPSRRRELSQLIRDEHYHTANAFIEMNKSNLISQIPLNLHGFIVREVAQILRQAIVFCEVNEIRKFGLICGHGYHGSGQVLLPAVKAMLSKRQIRYVDDLNGLVWAYLL